MRRHTGSAPLLLPLLLAGAVVVMAAGPGEAQVRRAGTTRLQGPAEMAPVTGEGVYSLASELELEPPTPSELGLGSGWGFDIAIPDVGFARLEGGDIQLRVRRLIPEAWTLDLPAEALVGGRLQLELEVTGASGRRGVLDAPEGKGSEIRVTSAVTTYSTTELAGGWVRLVGDVELELELDGLRVAGTHGGSLRVNARAF